jgi:hypothetical protein
MTVSLTSNVGDAPGGVGAANLKPNPERILAGSRGAEDEDQT